MAETAIEWTHRDGTVGKTWNPTTGCDKISPGCGLPRFPGDLPGGCYALTMAKRLKGMGSAKYQNDGDPRTSGPGFGLTVHPESLEEPFRWRKPATVFVNSMSDLFHARVPRDFLAEVFAVMAATPQHTYQILSKRPERMARILADKEFQRGVGIAIARRLGGHLAWRYDSDRFAVPAVWPLPGVWAGTSIETDDYVRRADALRATPASIRFISAEPLLGPLPSLDLTGINWLIAGGESGPGSRAMDLDWVRDLIARCRDSGTAPFVKQLGALQTTGPKDKKGGDWSAWPADLRVREYPTTSAADAA